jgi:hypothetical protein
MVKLIKFLKYIMKGNELFLFHTATHSILYTSIHSFPSPYCSCEGYMHWDSYFLIRGLGLDMSGFDSRQKNERYAPLPPCNRSSGLSVTILRRGGSLTIQKWKKLMFLCTVIAGGGGGSVGY